MLLQAELRREPFTRPDSVRIRPVANAIVQPARPSLPEFPFRGQNAVAAPGRRALERLVSSARGQVGKRLLHGVPSRDDGTLVRDDRAELAAAGPAVKVLVRLG